MSKRRVLLAAGAVVLCVAFAVPLVVGHSGAGADQVALTAWGADGSGAGVHVLGASNAFPNFRTGFLDNAYPLASAHLDASPAAQATASVADSGPLGSTAVAVADNPAVSQPQYAVSTFPGAPAATKTQGASVADAFTTEKSADARGALGAAGSGGPGAVEQPKDPGHTSFGEGQAHLSVDKVAGRVSSTSTGHVQRATFGSGALVIGNVEVTAGVTSDGATATPTYSIRVTGASVNGSAVEITDKGVVVQGKAQNGSDAASQFVNGNLNQSLANEGIKVFVTRPDVSVQGAGATVYATGVHVVIAPPSPNPSVPAQTIEYVLGEARAFAFATPATPAPVAAPPSAPVESAVSAPADLGNGSTQVLGTQSSASEPTPLPATPTGGGRARGAASIPRPVTTRLPTQLASSRSRPSWLIWLYLVWQALVLLSAGVVLWWRNALKASVAGG